MATIDSSSILVQEELQQAGNNINRMAEEIAQTLSGLISYLAPLADTWKGPAYSYYEGLQEQWNWAANGLLGPAESGGLLGEIASAMNVAWNNYSDAEWANVQTWQSPT